jgi:hypothetical protein
MRLGTLGAAGDDVAPPPEALTLTRAWREAAGRRLRELLEDTGGDAVIPPWLVQPSTPLASLLALRAREGAPGPVPTALRARTGSVERAAQALRALPSASAHAARWQLGDFELSVDPSAERVTLTGLERAEESCTLLQAHPWEPGVRGGLDTDAASTLALLRWLAEVIQTAGLDACVRWTPRDPEGPGGLEEGLHEVSVAEFLRFPLDPAEEALWDWRLRGLPVSARPWTEWAPPLTPGAPEEAIRLRERFEEAWVGSRDGAERSG